MSTFSILLGSAFTAILITVSAPFSFAEEEKPDYGFEYGEILRSFINPHEQISDEGRILWNKCLICHPNVPDRDKARSINDVKLRFEDDLKQGCFRCHPQRAHPGGTWVGRALAKGGGAPDHLIVPPDWVKKNIALSMKGAYTILPMEPKTGKIFCGTCHNPHERGLLKRRADAGADYTKRLRATGGSICQFCHRK